MDFVTKNYRRACRKLWLNRLKNRNFTVISNDCWGGEVYRDFGLPYLTPFVGLLVMAPCYIKLLKNLKENLETPLTFIPHSKYSYINAMRANENRLFPIGLLNEEIEIHFLHYQFEEEALSKWIRRVSRINWDNLFVKFDASKDLCTESLLEEYESLAFKKKVCLGAARNPGMSSLMSSLICIPGWSENGKAMYKIALNEFDVADWLNGGDGKPTAMYRMLLRGVG